MSRKNASSFLLLVSTNVIAKACWALTLIMLLRDLGAHSFGLLATLWSAAAIAAGFMDLGTHQAVLREGTRDHTIARSLARQSARCQTHLTLCAIFLLSAAAWWALPKTELPAWQHTLIILLSIAAPLVDRYQALFTVCSQVGGSFATYSATRSLYFIALLATLAWILARGGELLDVSLAYFCLTAIFALVTGIGTWVLLPAGDNTRAPPPIGKLLGQGFPFLVMTILLLAYGRIEVAIMGIMGSTDQAGSYHVIYQFVLLVYSVSGMFFTVIDPRLYRHRKDIDSLKSDFRDTARWLSLLGWMAAPPLYIFAEPILHMMGGTTLAANSPLLRALSTMVLVIPASAGLNFLLPLDRLGTRITSDSVGIAITALITVWAAIHNTPVWVPGGAVIGYASAMLIGHLALCKQLPGSTNVLAKEFLDVATRVLPGAALAWWMPGVWWLRAAVFFATSATLVLMTHPEVAERLRHWIAPQKP